MDIEEFYEKHSLSREEKDLLSDKINNLFTVINLLGKGLNSKDFSFFFNDDDEPYIQIYDENGNAIASIYARD